MLKQSVEPRTSELQLHHGIHAVWANHSTSLTTGFSPLTSRQVILPLEVLWKMEPFVNRNFNCYSIYIFQSSKTFCSKKKSCGTKHVHVYKMCYYKKDIKNDFWWTGRSCLTLRNPIPEVSYTSEKNIGLNLVIKVQTHCI